MLVPLFVVLVPCVIAVSQPAQITGHADQTAKYLPNWSSLDSRPLPEWYDQAKIGIFIHWGVFSVPSFGSEWFWYNWKGEQRPAFVEFMQKSYPPNFTYQDFGPDFTAEFFDPNKWADLFEKSGARYVVLTSKHHDGYTLWPSKYSFGWNTLSVGPNRDLVGAFADAIRNRTQLHFGLYHSLYEWFNPLYLNDKAINFSTNSFVTSKTMPELHELVELYSPEVIWSDGEWEAPSEYWTSKEFLAWLYNESPVRDTIVVNDRWGQDSLCKHGGYYTCVDRFNPGVLQAHKWENAMTIDKSSWGFRRDASLSDFLSIEELIKELISTVSCGGNILINVGPSKEGVITPIYEERLTQMGDWLNVYGEAVYNSTPWIYQNDTVTSDVWFTQRVDLQAVYATFLNWPKDGVLLLAYEPSTFSNSTVIELMTAGKLNWSVQDKVVHLVLPNQIEALSHWGWVLKLTTL